MSVQYTIAHLCAFASGKYVPDTTTDYIHVIVCGEFFDRVVHSPERCQCPDLPPVFSSRRTPSMLMPLSTALHMS